MTTTLSFHPVADLFPLMDDKALADLAEDIKTNGLLEPIWIHPADGRIVDGRNRYRACLLADVYPRTREWRGDGSLVAFVLSLNLKRRHLDTSQRAMVAARAIDLFKEEARERQGARTDLTPNLEEGREAAEDAARTVNVSRGSVYHAADVQAHGSPELVAAVDSGRVAVSTAAEIAHEPHEVQREIVARGEKEIIAAAKEIRSRRADERKREHHAKLAEAAESSPLASSVLTADQSIIQCDALITDPPYGILDEEWEPDDLESFTREWAHRWSKCSAHTIVVFWSQRYLWEGRRWLDESLDGYTFTQLLVWHAPNNTKPRSMHKFRHTWEAAYYYRRNGSEREVAVHATGWGDGLNDFDCHVAACPQSNFNDADLKIHPAQKPVSAMRWLIAATTLPGELVCDPFAGSGTTGVAAAQLGRRFHGIEISDEYRRNAEGRINLYGRAA